jgi:16S rRNA (uracil1498-N3)-methyltransferase
VAVQKLTELGVDRILLFPARRSVARWDGDRADRHLARLRRVAREAAMQSRRAHLPVVGPLTDLPTVLALPGAALADPAGAVPTLDHPTIVVGPEGGFDDDERALAARTVRLGPFVLRAETAAMAAGALLAGLRDGLVVPRDPRHDPTLWGS